MTKPRQNVFIAIAIILIVGVGKDLSQGKAPQPRRIIAAGILAMMLSLLSDIAPGVGVPVAYLAATAVTLDGGYVILNRVATLPTTGRVLGARPVGAASFLSGDPATSAGSQTPLAAAPNFAASVAINWAKSQLGTPYLWGGMIPRVGLDCSALVMLAWRRAGVNIPRTTYDQYKYCLHGPGHVIARGAELPGDLLFSNFGEMGLPGPGHVQLVIGNGRTIEAPHTGDVVKYNTYNRNDPGISFGRVY